ncbi:hypothetical protein MFLAVUS_008961 [Mucor flavus]|uniref:Mannose-6-phosphate isomerase n=1 Tax=Mucor flavus TaxID=439312 RepID=A0ABP9Z8L5_9FUNG
MDNSRQVLKLKFNNNANPGEFTRRKNWSQSVLESVRDIVHVLNDDLRIIYSSDATIEFLGYKPAELVQHVFTEFIHVDDIDMFVREFRATKLSMQTFRTTYRFLRKDGKYTMLETRGRFHKGSFFGSARKMPSGVANAIDSFLDLKMENETLKNKLRLLKNQHDTREPSAGNKQSSINTELMTTGTDEEGSSDEYDSFNIPANGTNVYTQGVNSNYNISESLSLFTGLRYDMGERSVGISLGSESGDLTTVGTNHPVIVSNANNLTERGQITDRPRLGKKQKRVDTGAQEPRICTDCGTTEAPEWRRGPNGPKTAIYRLQCNTQSYDWGKLGDVSKAATYAKASGTTVDNATPYAEFWMGTHPNAPSIVLDENKTTLSNLVKDNVELSTEPVYKQYNGDLPFLFKILSIRKALSIQAHPDKTLGARLFKEFPQNYKDPNHKPEMALALTPFEALCGFRPLNEIAHHMEVYPELTELIGKDVADEFLQTVKSTGDSTDTRDIEQNKAVLKKVFSALMHSSAETVKKCLADMIARINGDEDTISKLLVRLDQQYPGGDVGVFSSLLLNYISMEPGQAIFLGANEPHAYLSGDCVECMATSDNVVRAGLTPKFKDVDVLVDMLTYQYGSAESRKMAPIKYGDHSLLYDPPIDEFAVILTKLNAEEAEKHGSIEGPSILIVTSGSGKLSGGESLDEESALDLKEGYVYFIGANTPIVTTSDQSGLEFYRAYSVATDN